MPQSFLKETEYARQSGREMQLHSLCSRVPLCVDGQILLTPDFLAVNDFPPSDHWSEFMRVTLATETLRGLFYRQDVLELGVGDIRNWEVILRLSGDKAPPLAFHGVDIDSWRLDAAWQNHEEGLKDWEIPTTLYHCHAIEFLHLWQLQHGKHSFQGRVIMCLPQSPHGDNDADAYDPTLLATYHERHPEWNQTGLLLNGAVLEELAAISGPEARAVIILSNRIPEYLHMKVFHDTGWIVETSVQTREPIQQDPDTPIDWAIDSDDGQRFFERTADGRFAPISAQEAEYRRQKSVASGRGRDTLNVYHHLTIYFIQPNTPQE